METRYPYTISCIGYSYKNYRFLLNKYHKMQNFLSLQPDTEEILQTDSCCLQDVTFTLEHLQRNLACKVIISYIIVLPI